MQQLVILISVLLLLFQPVASRYLEEAPLKNEKDEEERWAPLVGHAARLGIKYGKPALKHVGKWGSAAVAAGLGSDAYKHAKAGIKKGYDWARNKWNRWRGGRRDALHEDLDDYLDYHQKFQ